MILHGQAQHRKAGGVNFPALSFPVLPQEACLFTPAVRDPHSRNISLDAEGTPTADGRFVDVSGIEPVEYVPGPQRDPSPQPALPRRRAVPGTRTSRG